MAYTTLESIGLSRGVPQGSVFSPMCSCVFLLQKVSLLSRGVPQGCK